MPISRVAQAKTGFHSVTSPFLRHFSATAFGRSNTHTRGAPPQLSRCCARLRRALHGLILHHRDAHPARVLQARGKEADAARRPIPKLDVHLSEVVLAEFSR